MLLIVAMLQLDCLKSSSFCVQSMEMPVHYVDGDGYRSIFETKVDVYSDQNIFFAMKNKELHVRSPP